MANDSVQVECRGELTPILLSGSHAHRFSDQLKLDLQRLYVLTDSEFLRVFLSGSEFTLQVQNRLKPVS
jgi:hypothetical protein